MATKKKSNRFRPSCTRLAFAKAFESNVPKIVVFADTETEGLNPVDDHIIQFSAIKFKYADGLLTKIDSIDTYIKNTKPLSDIIVNKIHITDEMLCDAPSEAQIFPVIEKFMEDVDVFCAYNEDFDYAFICELYRRQKSTFRVPITFDVMAMACDLYTMYALMGKSLLDVARYLKIKVDKKVLHNSMEDIELTVKVFEKMFPTYKATPIPMDRTGLRIPKIYKSWSWSNPDLSLRFNRIYFLTDCGKIFFESYDRSFGTDPKEKRYTVDELDLDSFIPVVLSFTHCANIEALAHLNPRPVKTAPDSDDATSKQVGC